MGPAATTASHRRKSGLPLPPGGTSSYRLALRRTHSFGRSALLFPRGGSVENRLPFALPTPREIRLDTAFEIAPPYGVDTYYLLTTDDPLPDPWILGFDGVRTRAPEPPTALEQLLLLTGSDRRAGPPRHAVDVVDRPVRF